MADTLNDRHNEPSVTIKLMYTDEGVMVEEYLFDGLEMFDAIAKAQREGG